MKLICYLSNGYPTMESGIRIAKEYVEAGCDIIEVDFPSSDPFLEGEYIAGRMKSALEGCSDYSRYMDSIKAIKSDNPNTKLVLLCYEDTILKIGTQPFIEFCTQNQIHDMIYVGGDNEEVKSSIIKSGMKISCYVQFHMPEEEIKAALASNGFVYMQAKPTANNINPLYPTLKDCIDELKRRGITREIYAGVGIYTTEDIQMAKNAGADAVFVGSTILKLQTDIPKMKEIIARFKKACSE
ncbi:tryptophan synthase alpha chain [Anaerobacterium chartisolvens]|uniref:tryptophan synthase n=1 Tax=Anaerobacterium chartisolvens TaxID=1297424 RepID=A0A369BHH9_9FIRM|nr:tryptophan synthase subunit alpha [Anaerobacterium chartisolvens]RCX20016.1 tryptophan synthase alpha chain [Anaerobacterium chartisolvens]